MRTARLLHIAAPGLGLALLLLFFQRMVLTDFVLARGDTFAYFYPYWQARSAALMAGQLPLWTPDLFMGVPLLANSQIGTFYPLNWLFTALPAPQAIESSILLHEALLIIGTYLLARRAASLNRLPALTAAVLFAFGGYMSGRVEQINQLQGLALLPWLLLLLHASRHQPLRYVMLLSTVLALQIFTGHTQTVFLSGVGLGLYALCSPQRWRLLLVLAVSSVFALALALPQLVPTLELMALSNRGDGLNANEATAFSLNPFLAARGMLPSYDLPIFAEYIAYPGLIGLMLIIAGATARHPEHSQTSRLNRVLSDPRLPWLVLAVIGLGFAFGQYNPIYAWLAELPGFNWFRVPARWLVLMALGSSVLAGIGVQQLQQLNWRERLRTLLITLMLIAGLAAAALVLTERNPEPVPATPPTDITLIGWSIAALAGAGLLVWRGPQISRLLPALLLSGVTLELWAASRVMPYNQLVPPDVVSSQRFSVSQLRAYGQETQPAGRLLSISNLLFDPGDRLALETRYRALGLSETEIRNALVAIKLQEVVGANLGLSWGIPSIDGFDGGLLPTRYYSAFTSLMLPSDSLRTVDGRLREALARESCRGACIPDGRWLALSNTQYLLIDKVYDFWNDNTAYDTAFTVNIDSGQEVLIERLTPFESAAVDVVLRGNPPLLAVETASDTQIISTPQRQGEFSSGYLIWRYLLPEIDTPTQIRLSAQGEGIEVIAVTLVDTRTDDFQQVTLGEWTRQLSSDIKIYENLSTLPRAFVVFQAQFLPDDALGTEAGLEIMRDPAFDPTRQAVIFDQQRAGQTQQSQGHATTQIERYTPTEIVIRVTSDAPGFLMLSDAYYPGWEAVINDNSSVIYRANIMFRGIEMTPGTHTVVFRYQPFWLKFVPFWGIFWILWVFIGSRVAKFEKKMIS